MKLKRKCALGGLRGQSLIESAKINRFVDDLRQYEVAVTQFKVKFKCYPVDPIACSDQNAVIGDFVYYLAP